MFGIGLHCIRVSSNCPGTRCLHRKMGDVASPSDFFGTQDYYDGNHFRCRQYKYNDSVTIKCTLEDGGLINMWAFAIDVRRAAGRPLRPGDKVLYHYTNKEGFDAITDLGGQELWTSSERDTESNFGYGCYATEKAPHEWTSKHHLLVNNFFPCQNDWKKHCQGKEWPGDLDLDKHVTGEVGSYVMMECFGFGGKADYCIPVIVDPYVAKDVMKEVTDGPLMPDKEKRLAGHNRHGEKEPVWRNAWVISIYDQNNELCCRNSCLVFDMVFVDLQNPSSFLIQSNACGYIVSMFCLIFLIWSSGYMSCNLSLGIALAQFCTIFTVREVAPPMNFSRFCRDFMSVLVHPRTSCWSPRAQSSPQKPLPKSWRNAWMLKKTMATRSWRKHSSNTTKLNGSLQRLASNCSSRSSSLIRMIPMPTTIWAIGFNPARKWPWGLEAGSSPSPRRNSIRKPSSWTTTVLWPTTIWAWSFKPRRKWPWLLEAKKNSLPRMNSFS